VATRVQESSASSSLSQAWSHIEKESSPGIWAQGQLITMGTAEQVGGRQQGWCGQAQGPWGWLWLLSWVPLPQPLAGWAGHRKCWKSAGLGADLYAASCFHLTDGENKTSSRMSHQGHRMNRSLTTVGSKHSTGSDCMQVGKAPKGFLLLATNPLLGLPTLPNAPPLSPQLSSGSPGQSLPCQV
jgi:hypothetical protein